MSKTTKIVILGRSITLYERDKSKLKGINIGDSLSYRFFDGTLYGVLLLFAEPRGNASTPLNLSITASNLTSKFGLPTVFLLPSCPAYERQRLIDKNVYFVVSDKYAYLPMLIANERIRKTKPAKTLIPMAQYLLLYHLQVESLEGLAARDLENRLPYSYANITLGITCLADLGLCEKLSDGYKRKTIHFAYSKMNLWKQAQPLLFNPVIKRTFCDEFKDKDEYPICGINALAYYTRLNSLPERMIMTTEKKIRELSSSGALVRQNEFDGNILIETWKYPPVAKQGDTIKYVDRLSLALSLRDDDDARVEGEVERMINEIAWKD